MKFVVAPDSFKGSISAKDVAACVEKGIKTVLPDCCVITKPIADGGEGTLDAIVPADCRHTVQICGPLFERMSAQYGWIGDTAVIEMAAAAGLTLIDEKRRNAGNTTTHGVGSLIRDALQRGFRKIMLTVGGSATNDGGCGMLAALGAVFKDCYGDSFVPTGNTLDLIWDIDVSQLMPELSDCEIIIATDVKNPLIGELGATNVFAPQKGLVDGQQEFLEEGMEHYAEIVRLITGKDITMIEGVGAGGGIAAPLLAFTGATIRSGIDTVLDVIGFDAALEGVDAVITGEGRIDAQSLYGKAISGVAARVAAKNIPVICFAGCVDGDLDEIKRLGVKEIYTVMERAKSKEDSMQNAGEYLTCMAREFAVKFTKK